MANYKPWTISFTIDGMTRTFVAEPERALHIYDDTGLGTAADGFRKSFYFDAQEYVVPTGFTFHAKGLIIDWAAVSGNVIIYQGNTENGTDNARLTINNGTGKAGIREYGTDYIITSEKWITIKPSAANINHCTVMGYETKD